MGISATSTSGTNLHVSQRTRQLESRNVLGKPTSTRRAVRRRKADSERFNHMSARRSSALGAITSIFRRDTVERSASRSRMHVESAHDLEDAEERQCSKEDVLEVEDGTRPAVTPFSVYGSCNFLSAWKSLSARTMLKYRVPHAYTKMRLP